MKDRNEINVPFDRVVNIGCGILCWWKRGILLFFLQVGHMTWYFRASCQYDAYQLGLRLYSSNPYAHVQTCKEKTLEERTWNQPPYVTNGEISPCAVFYLLPS